jgi:plastocyanin
VTPDKRNGRPTARQVRLAGILLAVVALVAAGCSGGPAQTVVGTPAVTLALVAESSKFDSTSLAVPAGSPFAIAFENLDALPHNVSIRGGSSPIVTEVFTGPAERTYVYPALPAGSYTFICDVHPEMTGTLTAN